MRLLLALFLALPAYAQAQVFPYEVEDPAISRNLYFLWENILRLNGVTGTITSYLPATAEFGGDVSGTYDNLVVIDNSHLHNMSTLQGVLSSSTTVPVMLLDLSTVTAAIDLKVSKAGDTMTGDLVMSASSITFTNPGSIENINRISFNTAYSNGCLEGSLQWGAEDGTLEICMPGGNVLLQVGQETVVRVKNATAGTLYNGRVVAITGASGMRPTVDYADADGSLYERFPIAVLTEDIASGQNGYATVRGTVRTVETSGWGESFTEGQVVYASTANGQGYFTAFPAPAPARRIPIGVIQSVAGTQVNVLVQITSLPDQIVVSTMSFASGEYATSFSAGVQTSHINYTLPVSTDMVGGRFLQIDENGNLSWQEAPVSGEQSFYFSQEASDLAGYYAMYSSYPFVTASTAPFTLTTADVSLGTWTTLSGYPQGVTIPAGRWEVHIHAEQTAVGAKDTRLYGQFYKRSSAGALTYIGQTEYSSILNGGGTELNVHLVSDEISLTTGDRIIVNGRASVSGGGVNPQINVFFGGLYYSGVHLPAANVDTSNFVPYAGASGDLNLGSYDVYADEFYGDGANLTGVLLAPATFYVVKQTDYLQAPATFYVVKQTDYLQAPATFYVVQQSDYLVAPATFYVVTVTDLAGRVSKTGDTMSGSLVLNSGNLTAATGNITATKGNISAGGLVSAYNGYYLGGQIFASTRNATGSSISVGFGAGANNTGASNTYVGDGSGGLVTSGRYNTFTGAYAGGNLATGEYNSFYGMQAGLYHTAASYNTSIGANAGWGSGNPLHNTSVGYEAGKHTGGSSNVALGSQAGLGVVSNSYSSSTIVGASAGQALTTGSNNVLMGFQAGNSLTTGAGNIIIGYDQDAPAATTSNYLNLGGLLLGTVGGSSVTVRGDLFVDANISAYAVNASSALSAPEICLAGDCQTAWASGAGDMVLAATQTVTGAKTFTSSATFEGPTTITSTVTLTNGHNIPCPTGFTSMESTGGKQYGCIQTAENGSAGHWTANQTCLTSHGGRLPSFLEIKTAFTLYTLTDEADDAEWVSDMFYTNGVDHRGFQITSAGVPTYDLYSNSFAYRCFIPR